MAAKKGAIPLTEAELIAEVHTRIENDGGGIPKATVTAVVKALKAEMVDCLINGYKVGLSGVFSLTPTAKAGRKKGTVVRNPFDGSTKTLRSDEPDKFKVKAKASPAVLKEFPGVRSAAGADLMAMLTPPKRKPAAKKAATAKAKSGGRKRK